MKDLSKLSVCPNCNSKIKLSKNDITTKKVHCPKCEALIDFNFELPKVLKKENYVEFLSAINIGDISMIRSLLDSGGIDYYIFEENFVHVRPLLEPARLFVNETQIEEVKEILKDFDLHIWGLSSDQS
jgi:DNA-directed RNA polymerase subunit M/transcription elongation factor TFIIS